MPKLKTKKGVAKRFRIRKSGSIKHRSAYTGHILSSKSKSRKRGHKKPAGLKAGSDIALIRRQMPYG